MSNIEKISVALPKDMTASVQKAVARGRYASVSEVVREALRDWQDKQDVPKLSIEDIRRFWQEGVDGGKAKIGSFDAIRSEARRLAAGKKTSKL